MAVHVAILLKRYIELILAGDKSVESRLTITPRTPYRRIAPGERIYFKASAGPFMATAVADAVEFYDSLTPARVAALKKQWNSQVRGEAGYWLKKSNSRYATFIRLRDVQPAATGPRIPPSQGLAWFTLSDTMAPPAPPAGASFEIALTAGGIRNGYVAAPRALRANGAIRLRLPDGQTVQTDVYRGQRIRWRGWRKLFSAHQVEPGDRVRLEETSPQNYRVCFNNDAGEIHRPPVEDVGLRQGIRRDGKKPSKVKRGKEKTLTPALSLRREREPEPRLLSFVTRSCLKKLVAVARREDLGPASIDLTSELLIPAEATTQAVFRARQAGRLSGAALLPEVVAAYDPSVKLTPLMADGQKLEPGSRVAELSGSLRSILALERVALNFLTHLSGIASLTARFVDAVAGSKARIYDTRKTHPGLRELEKYAVVCGGGYRHRMGLFDAVLVKDNHIAHLPIDELPPALQRMMDKARALRPAPDFIMIEVDSLAQLQRVLPVGPDIVLLDNMAPDVIRQAVALRDRLAPPVELEVSGGVRLDNVGAIAQTGIDRISIGALTHSAPALDLGLDILS